jgi:arylsulfatase A-like enzyme
MKMNVNFILALSLLSISSNVWGQDEEKTEKPNLVVVYTDEHNFRTIGAYRELLDKKYSEIWGDGVVVDTPNLDRLAKEGAIFTSMYTVAPLCTPSRASFMTGLYPKETGAWLNHNAMNSDMQTWAKILKKWRGYHTGYVGKWHLNGDEKPGWNNPNKFGFIDTKWQYNRGHWKFFEEDDNGFPKAYEWTPEAEAKFANTMEKNYATDFLMDRGLEIIDRALEQDKPFAVMISIPDPHSPNIVRAPYNTMYNDMEFGVTYTAKAAIKKKPALPSWSTISVDVEDAVETIDTMEADRIRHRHFSNIYGMVKLIDDNVGKLLDHLEAKGVDENTIVVFSSDHGDMLGEHAKHNKGRPYETSAGVPMLMRWPNKVSAGKIINTAYSSVDFAPTILKMMGVDKDDLYFQGIDGSDEILAPGSESNEYTKKQTRFITDSAQSKWASAVRDDYKLTLSGKEPWLFDLSKDPHELVNVYGDANYTDIVEEMQDELYDAMFLHKFPLAEQEVVYWGRPGCWDSSDQLSMWKKRLCLDLADPLYSPGCQWRAIYEQCPVACQRCCKDSPGKLLISGSLKTCQETSNLCEIAKVRKFCPRTCNACPGQAMVKTIAPEEEEIAGEEIDGNDDLTYT